MRSQKHILMLTICQTISRTHKMLEIFRMGKCCDNFPGIHAYEILTILIAVQKRKEIKQTANTIIMKKITLHYHEQLTLPEY